MRTVKRRIREPRTRHEGRLDAIMKVALVQRLQRLEEVRAAEPGPLELRFGYLKKLPLDYTEERQIGTQSRLPDGKYQWERPGPAPANE